MARREDLRINYGQGLRLPDLYQELPHLNQDSEFMTAVFFRARELCVGQKLEVTWQNVFRQARNLMSTEFKEEFRDHSDPRHQFSCSLADPGLEVMRYFPRIAKRLGMNVERELAPLWEYVDPDPHLRLKFRHWNYFSQMLYDLSELKEKLLALEEKPTLRMFHHRGEHGLIASIRGDTMQIAIRENLDEHDVANAKTFEGTLGPTILQVTDRWIVEEFIDLPSVAEYDLFSTRAPKVYGNLIGCALRQIHDAGFSYNASLENSVLVNPETNKLFVTNWCHARQNGKTAKDLDNIRQTLKNRYLHNIGEPNQGINFISSNGTIPFIQASRGFHDGYTGNKQYPLSSSVK